MFDRTTNSASSPLYIGSVKPNIGHLEAGAGLAGLIKTVLTLEAGIIPPNINFVNANPKLRLEDLNFAIPIEPVPWPSQGLRRASVNSFGYGGRSPLKRLVGLTHSLQAPMVIAFWMMPTTISPSVGFRI